MKLPENKQEDYYEQKSVNRLESFKSDIKAIIIVLFIGIGYWSYLHNHIVAFTITTFVLGVNYFLFKFLKGVGKRNDAYNDAHKDLEKK